MTNDKFKFQSTKKKLLCIDIISFKNGVWVVTAYIVDLFCPLSNTSKVGGGSGKAITRNGEKWKINEINVGD